MRCCFFILLMLLFYMPTKSRGQDFYFRFGLGYATSYNRLGISIAMPMDFPLRIGRLGFEAGTFVYFPTVTEKIDISGNKFNEKSNILEANLNAYYSFRLRKNGIGFYPLVGWNTTFDLITADNSFQRNNRIRFGINWGLGTIIPMGEKFSFISDLRYVNSFERRYLLTIGFQYRFQEVPVEQDLE